MDAAEPRWVDHALSVSPDGAMLASGRDDGMIQLWDHRFSARRYALCASTAPMSVWTSLAWLASPRRSGLRCGRSARSRTRVVRACFKPALPFEALALTPQPSPVATGGGVAAATG